jgi:tripartite-type tricarboxylate transporter receptor subunit TctC
LPDVPTARDAGYGALTGTEWFGLLAPSATPADRVAALHAAVAKAVASDSVKTAFGKLVLDPSAMAPGEFAMRIKADLERWAAVAKSLNYQRVDAN